MEKRCPPGRSRHLDVSRAIEDEEGELLPAQIHAYALCQRVALPQRLISREPVLLRFLCQQVGVVSERRLFDPSARATAPSATAHATRNPSKAP